MDPVRLLFAFVVLSASVYAQSCPPSIDYTNAPGHAFNLSVFQQSAPYVVPVNGAPVPTTITFNPCSKVSVTSSCNNAPACITTPAGVVSAASTLVVLVGELAKFKAPFWLGLFGQFPLPPPFSSLPPFTSEVSIEIMVRLSAVLPQPVISSITIINYYCAPNIPSPLRRFLPANFTLEGTRAYYFNSTTLGPFLQSELVKNLTRSFNIPTQVGGINLATITPQSAYIVGVGSSKYCQNFNFTIPSTLPPLPPAPCPPPLVISFPSGNIYPGGPNPAFNFSTFSQVTFSPVTIAPLIGNASSLTFNYKFCSPANTGATCLNSPLCITDNTGLVTPGVSPAADDGLVLSVIFGQPYWFSLNMNGANMLIQLFVSIRTPLSSSVITAVTFVCNASQTIPTPFTGRIANATQVQQSIQTIINSPLIQSFLSQANISLPPMPSMSNMPFNVYVLQSFAAAACLPAIPPPPAQPTSKPPVIQPTSAAPPVAPVKTSSASIPVGSAGTDGQGGATNNGNSGSSGPSAGLVVGIIALILALIAIAVAVVVYVRKRKSGYSKANQTVRMTPLLKEDNYESPFA